MFSEIAFGKMIEMRFCLDAAKRSLNVSTPQLDLSGYDFIVESTKNKLYKIQVKSTAAPVKNKKNYKINVSRGSRTRVKYKKIEIDFFACYLNDLKQWYIIPFDAVHSVSIRIYPHNPNHTYTKYLEAWHLIK